MINPLTFDASPSEAHLSWSRDDATIIDTITSAKTKSQPVTGFNHPELAGRGSNPLYVTEFIATANDKTNTIMIKLLRGYIAGRYFEVTNKTLKTKTKGFTILRINANAVTYKIDSVSLIDYTTLNRYTQSVGQAFGMKSINDSSRTQSENVDRHLIYTYSVLYWQVTDDTETPCYIDSSTINNFDFNNIESNPYMRRVKNKESIQILPVFSSKFGNIEGESKIVTVGDTKTGLLTCADTPGESINMSLGNIDPFISKGDKSQLLPTIGIIGGSSGNINLNTANLEYAPFLGIVSKKLNVPIPNNDIKISDFISHISNYPKYTPFGQSGVDILTSPTLAIASFTFYIHDIDNHSTLSLAGIQALNDPTSTNRKGETKSFVSPSQSSRCDVINDHGIDRVQLTTTWVDDVLKSNTYNFDNLTVKYIQREDMPSIDKFDGVYLPSSVRAYSEIAVINIPISINTVAGDTNSHFKYTLNITRNRLHDDPPQSSQISYDGRLYPTSLKLYVPISSIAYYNEYKNNTLIADISIVNTAEKFKRKLQENGLSEMEFWRKFIKPYAAVALYNKLYNTTLPDVLASLEFNVKQEYKSINPNLATFVHSTQMGVNQQKAVLQ